MTITEIITDEQIDKAWGHANFGAGQTKRDIIKYAVLKAACGYKNGHTADCIIYELGLTRKTGLLSNKGREYLWECFGKSNS